MAAVEQDLIFRALTRPQMFAGVTYSYFVANAVMTAEAFLIFKSPWVVALAALVHIVGYVACLNEPRFFELWLTRVSRNPRVRNHGFWRCNSYAA